jgi:hypothetical protein
MPTLTCHIRPSLRDEDGRFCCATCETFVARTTLESGEHWPDCPVAKALEPRPLEA